MPVQKGTKKLAVILAILVAIAIAAGIYFTHHNSVPQ